MNQENIEDAKQYLLSLYTQSDDPRTIDIAKQEQFLRSEYYLSEPELQVMYTELSIDHGDECYSENWLRFVMAMSHQTILVTVVAGAVNICQYRTQVVDQLLPYLRGYIDQSEGQQRLVLQSMQTLLHRIITAQAHMQAACDEYMHRAYEFNNPTPPQ